VTVDGSFSRDKGLFMIDSKLSVFICWMMFIRASASLGMQFEQVQGVNP
jgi:hypothetical protein